MGKRNKGIFLKISYLLYLVLFLVILDVVYVNIIEKIPPLRNQVYLQMAETSIHQRSEIAGLFYELKPGAQSRYIQINSWGMRDHEPNLKKEGLRVLVMGDSVTFGEEVKQQQLFTEVAEDSLKKTGYNIEILNAGVSAYNTNQEYIALKEKYLSLNPDLVIFAFVGNDLGMAAIQFLPDDYIQKKLLSAGIKEREGNYADVSIKQYLALSLPKQFPLNYNLDRWLLLHSGIYRTISLLSFKKGRKIKSWEDLPNFIGNYDFEQTLKEIKSLAAEKNFALQFILTPVQVDYYLDNMVIANAFSTVDIPVWNLQLIFRERLKQKFDNCFFSDIGLHLTVSGHRLLGELLAQKIEEFLKSRTEKDLIS